MRQRKNLWAVVRLAAVFLLLFSPGIRDGVAFAQGGHQHCGTIGWQLTFTDADAEVATNGTVWSLGVPLDTDFLPLTSPDILPPPTLGDPTCVYELSDISAITITMFFQGGPVPLTNSLVATVSSDSFNNGSLSNWVSGQPLSISFPRHQDGPAATVHIPAAEGFRLLVNGTGSGPTVPEGSTFKVNLTVQGTHYFVPAPEPASLSLILVVLGGTGVGAVLRRRGQELS